MRMRKKKHGAERIEACGDLILHSAADIPTGSVHLEIGCGKGAFITECAKRNPEISFVALERISDVLLLAAEKVRAEGLTNVRFLIEDAKNIPQYFAPGQVERIYLNFSDPWPKKGYAKRRLTHESYLALYRQVLSDTGSVFLKTDNKNLFDFSLSEFDRCGFRLKNITYDLHHSPLQSENIMTEYEANFSAKGFAINRVEAYVDPSFPFPGPENGEGQN